ncbi:DUF5916 domain-containing protein [Aureivirga sp. CE67]|uniref:DUF5916 domain-containing protein n=1 Tax=Aureivirga sp. CE67 TaxID=1788983 RepID=UPI0018CA6E1A|nr:DUF5916 domain-containing protein [Aureivirga sp. CE67]
MTKKKISFVFLFFLTFLTFGQTKQLFTKKVDEAPKIDGYIDDPVWSEVGAATDFVMLRPTNGAKEPEDFKTIVKVVYDDEGIYFAAEMFDPEPEKIPMEFTTRDRFGQSDFIGIVINPINDKQNDTQFYIMSTGTQADAKATVSNGEDYSWNAVWTSKVRMTDTGWVCEVKIPYDALRFKNEKEQIWGINFHRRIQRKKHQYSWNFIDLSIGNIQQYAGELRGIHDIKPPTRLSLFPYASGVIQTEDKETTKDLNIGMDIKYGVTENFTIDATLIPDFSQTAFDNIVLNLGPFEQRFAERRQFFIEGIELFTKGGLFYSRRIGGTPIYKYDVNINDEVDEEITENPDKANLINAVKFSGRTKKGLGIGVLNALTKRTYAKVHNPNTGTSREELTSPLTNYSMIVLDQQYGNNSSITFVNSNTLRENGHRKANVSALLWDLANKKNTFKVDGNLKTSLIFENDETKQGISSNLGIRKTSGHYRYGAFVNYIDEKFDNNDLGFQRINNYIEYGFNASYRIFKPTKTFNSFYTGFWGGFEYLKKPYTYTGNYLGWNFNASTKKEHAFGGNINANIGKQKDYYEPRKDGRYFLRNPRVNGNIWISSDYRRRLALDLNAFYGGRINFGNLHWYGYRLGPRFRVNNKMTLVYSFNYEREFNDKGWVDSQDDAIIFGNRDRKQIVNSLSTNYNFNTKSAVSISFRHYWSQVGYDSFFDLQNDGTLEPTDYDITDNNPDVNFNSWNLELSYKWEFAPGSLITAFYRNTINNSDDMSKLSFSKNIDNLFDNPLNQTFSLRVVHFIDYSTIKRII